jgi:hypothetical protein
MLNQYYFLFSVIQKLNKKYWFYIKEIVFILNNIEKDKIKKKIRINFLNKLIKRKKPIFTKKLRYFIKKQNFSYRFLMESKNKYNLFLYKKFK